MVHLVEPLAERAGTVPLNMTVTVVVVVVVSGDVTVAGHLC